MIVFLIPSLIEVVAINSGDILLILELSNVVEQALSPNNVPLKSYFFDLANSSLDNYKSLS